MASTEEQGEEAGETWRMLGDESIGSPGFFKRISLKVYRALGYLWRQGRSRADLQAAQTVGIDLALGPKTPEERPVQTLGENLSSTEKERR